MPVKIVKTMLLKNKPLLEPIMMLHNKHSHCIFQQYLSGVPQEEYYINCGANEPAVISIWKNEDGNFELTTQNITLLKDYLPHVKVVDVTDEVEISITIEETI